MKKMPFTILMVDDEEDDCLLVGAAIRDAGYLPHYSPCLALSEEENIWT